ncbi:MAG: MSCRAMM family adhesin SdrC [Aquabacterium sp.]|nr:MSCRAMM family adhesin SdrC [Aquabacterium sp.]
MSRLPALVVLSLAALLSGCEKLGIQTPADVAAGKEADARAIGSACRQAGRAIEDCYSLNPKAGKAAVFAGWREMDEYMRENKLDVVPPTVPRPGASAPAAGQEADAEDGEDAASDAPSKTDSKADSKTEADRKTGSSAHTDADQAEDAPTADKRRHAG